MKRLIFISLCMCVVVTVGIDLPDNITDLVADAFPMSKMDAQTCINKTNVNLEKVKEELDIMERSTPEASKLSNQEIALQNQMLDNCIDQVINEPNECAVILKMVICLTKQIKRNQKQWPRG